MDKNKNFNKNERELKMENPHPHFLRHEPCNSAHTRIAN